MASLANRLGAMRESDHQVEAHLVADDPAPSLESSFPIQKPVQTVDHGRGRQGDALTAGSVDLPVLEPHVEPDRARDVPDRQIAKNSKN